MDVGLSCDKGVVSLRATGVACRRLGERVAFGWRLQVGARKSPLARALGGSEAVTQVEGHNRHEPVSSGRSRLARRMT